MTSSRAGDQQSWIGWVQIAAILAVVGVAIVITLILSPQDAPSAGESSSNGATRVPVEIGIPERLSHTLSLSSTGTTQARALVALTAQVSGRVIEVSDKVRSGGTFQAGEVLFQIEPADYEIAVVRAEAALAEARSAYIQTEANAELARREWMESFPDTEISPLAAREPQLEAARSRLLSAQADLAQAGLNLDRTEVSFPFAGRITESRVEEGLLIQAGQSYGAVYNFNELEIIAPVSADELAGLGQAIGRQADITFENGMRGTAEIIREGAILDQRSRLVDLFMTPLDGEGLRPGLFAEITIRGDVIDEAMSVPARAVQGLDSIFIVQDGIIQRQTVTLLDRTGPTVILTPFDYGDGVILSPIPEGSEGREAHVINPDGADEG